MLYALDIETTGLSSFSDRLLCIGVYNEQTGYTSFADLSEFMAWHSPDHQYICHNGKFDVNFIRRAGLDIRSSFAYDTRSIATILVPIPELSEGQSYVYGLENLSIQLLGDNAYKLDRNNLADVPRDVLLDYNQHDCKNTWALFSVLLDKLAGQDWQFVENWVMPATKLLADMEYNGVYIDQPRLTLYDDEVNTNRELVLKELLDLTKDARSAWHEKEITELGKAYEAMVSKAIVKAKDKDRTRLRYQGLFEKAKEKIEAFNFNSSTQLKWLLKDFYGLNIFNSRSKKETTDEAMLKEHAGRNAFCEVLVRYRELEKLVSTCIPALLDNVEPDNRVHPSFNIGGTRTGRLSSSGPNFQQVPKGPIRSCVIASPGHVLLVADYAQIEVRIMAELAKEEELINAFKEEIDPYSIIASKLFRIDCELRELKSKFPKERNTAKTAGLSILYGTGAAKLQEVIKKDLGIDHSLQTCRSYIESYRQGFAQIKALKERLEMQLANQKKVYNLLGRPSYIHDNGDLYMTALNTIVQGSASDLVIKAFTKVYEAFPFIRPVLVVHDEIVMEIPEDKVTNEVIGAIEAECTTAMEQLLGLSVPLKIEYEVGQEWVKP